VLHGHFPFVLVFSLKCLLKIFHILYDLAFTSKGFLILLLTVLVVENLRVVTWVQFYIVLAVINGTVAESDSENESDNDDSVLNKNCEMPVDQCESHGRPTTSCLESRRNSVGQGRFFSESWKKHINLNS
jgi:hypothetical protein